MMGKGKEAAHSGCIRSDGATVVHVDYAFLSFDGEENVELQRIICRRKSRGSTPDDPVGMTTLRWTPEFGPEAKL